MRDRKITFTNIGIVQGSRVWRNSETGVEIIKGKNFEEVGLYYVCIPVISPNGAGRRMVSHQTSLSRARSMATDYVWTMRHWIEEAYTAACLEDAYRNRHRAQLRNWRWPHLGRGLLNDRDMVEADHVKALSDARSTKIFA